jgi:branched-chain amino acid transport system permease protein
VTLFLSYVIGGFVTGCIYALISSGLVVTYTTTGVFNFAHGAIAMVAAFSFWELWQHRHINVLLSVLLVLVVIAPLFGLIVERVLMRPLEGAPVDIPIVVTLGLLLFLVGLANLVWSPQVPRALPLFFRGAGFSVAGLLITYEQVVAAAALVAVAVGLRLLFTRTRIGIALRAVVDSSDLLAMAGGRPARVRQLAWAMSCSLAAMAGILLAGLTQLNILDITLLVVDGYAAAIIGRLRSLPLAIGGALVIAVGQAVLFGYLPSSGFTTRIQDIIPVVVLFVVLIVLPQDRLRSASFTGVVPPRVASLGSSVGVGAIVIVAAILISGALSSNNLLLGAKGFAVAIVLLSIMLLTGYGGMVSLCQMTFVGLGAYAMGNVAHGGSWLGVLAAIALSATVGAFVALPTLRLRGLYLALATFAFAAIMDSAFFLESLGTGGSLTVGRLKIPGLPTQSNRAYFNLCCVAFVICAIGVLAVRRGSFGRKLVAANDSPAACATLGVNVNSTKLIAFTVSAGLAGLAGVLYGGSQGQVGSDDFAALVSLTVLLLARVGGINTATGALLGAASLTFFAVIAPHTLHVFGVTIQLGAMQYLLTGLAAISVGRDPNGISGRFANIIELFRAATPTKPAAAATPGTPAATFIAEEGESLVGAGH